MASHRERSSAQPRVEQAREDSPRPGRPEVATLITEFDANGEVICGGEEHQAVLLVLSGPAVGSRFAVEHRPNFWLGRAENAPVSIADPGLSREHAALSYRGGDVWLRDLGSTNGTFVNGSRLKGEQRLEEGDRIQFGQSTVLQLSIQDGLEQRAFAHQHEMLVRDGLTGLYNRRHLDERLSEEFAYAMRHRAPLALLLLDVDHFKRVNDTHGHPAGDEVLVAVGKGLSVITRAEDLVARYGGEEFVVLARGIDANCGLACAERIRTYLAALQVPVPNGREAISFTVSVGVAHTEIGDYQDGDELLIAADRALYRAKALGRDRVELAEGPGINRRPSDRPRREVRVMTAPVLEAYAEGVLSKDGR